MRALCWQGTRHLSVEDVPEPRIRNPRDAIVRVGLSATCGSDLHLVNGYVPTMKKGDILGHEFVGEVVDAGPEVKTVKPGDRVVVPSFVACGQCWFCEQEMFSLCDTSNPNHAITEELFGDGSMGAVYGYSHAFGGYAGSHAEYIRVPFADVDCVKVPEGLEDEQVVFVSDALATGYMGADFCRIDDGDVIAVWGAGGVGQMAIASARLLGAERVIAIDRFPYRLRLAAEKAGADHVVNYEEENVLEALQELTGGRGPDACIDCVGMEAHAKGLEGAYDRAKNAVMLEQGRPHVLREMIRACRKGGTISILGVYGGLVDKFPIGIAMNKGLTFRMAQVHGQKYARRLLEHIEKGEIDPSYLITHRLPLEEGPRGYKIFNNKEEDCVRVVFAP
ncbi:MAG TPA: zinc-dependent alcohol dehydrogenase [Planctomycetota bacterium]|nr:zinc-dependent alcohol dehydrogenase [Planctomycetota bacterium]